jgi:hypothetical protein
MRTSFLFQLYLLALFALSCGGIVAASKTRKLMQESNEKFHCSDVAVQAMVRRANENGAIMNDYIVGVKKYYNVDRVLDSLDEIPKNLQRFELLGNMFAATLGPKEVSKLLTNEGVEYVECDATVSIGLGK